MSSPRLTDFCRAAVIFHDDGNALFFHPPDLYKTLFAETRRWLHKHGVPLIHLSTKGHEKWGDENVQYDGNPRQVMYNREIYFRNLLRDTEETEGYYLFMEPDMVMRAVPEPTTADLMLLHRPDDVEISPCFRLAKKSALPYFEALVEHYPPEEWKENAKCSNKEWHGDSDAHQAVKEKYFPDLTVGEFDFKGITVEFRPHSTYIGKNGKFFPHSKWTNKLELYKNIVNK